MSQRQEPGQFEAMAFLITLIGTLIGMFAIGVLVSVLFGLLFLVAGIFLLIIIGLFRPQLYQLVYFIFLLGSVPRDEPSGGFQGHAWACVVRKGANPNDPMAPRVVIEDASGRLHTSEVLPPDGDLQAAWRHTIVKLQLPVREVRAERGGVVESRWTPSWWSRIRAAWAVAWRR